MTAGETTAEPTARDTLDAESSGALAQNMDEDEAIALVLILAEA